MRAFLFMRASFTPRDKYCFNKWSNMTPRKLCDGQRRAAHARNIEWQLTFEEWWDWWQATGHWEERGRCKGQYVMARFNDVGPYSLENIFCTTVENNHRHLGTSATSRRLAGGNKNCLAGALAGGLATKQKLKGKTYAEVYGVDEANRRKYKLSKEFQEAKKLEAVSFS